ncbi:MAG: AraC family transcriptional regulator [Fimbriimonadaceae bacterium]
MRPPRLEATWEETVLARCSVERLASGSVLGERSEPWLRLSTCVGGIATFRGRDGRLVLAEGMCACCPPSWRHAVSATRDLELRSLFIRPSLADRGPELPQVFGSSTLLDELVARASGRRLLRSDDPRDVRLVESILDEVAGLEPQRQSLRLPTTPWARRIAEGWLTAPGDRRPIDRVAVVAGVSRRTLERTFREETGLSAGGWRQRSRLLEAQRLLVSGEPVRDVAVKVGYQSDSAFVVAFRSVHGVTPYRAFGRASKRRAAPTLSGKPPS